MLTCRLQSYIRLAQQTQQSRHQGHQHRYTFGACVNYIHLIDSTEKSSKLSCIKEELLGLLTRHNIVHYFRQNIHIPSHPVDCEVILSLRLYISAFPIQILGYFDLIYPYTFYLIYFHHYYTKKQITSTNKYFELLLFINFNLSWF